MGRIDFTSCPLVLSRAYNGANGKKIAVLYQDAPYMIKFPPSGANKPTQLSYTNSCISEHIASSIFNLLGIKAQETILGTYGIEGKTKLVCACRDFTTNSRRLFDFCSIKNTVLDSESNGSGTELADILDTIEKQNYIDPAILTDHFWNVFVVDALLGNFDRHNGNWGFLYDEATDKAELAPIYDCGSCLLPQADEAVMQSVLSDESALHARVFQFPTSAIKLDDKKINYYDFLMAAEYKECNDAVKRIVPRIDMQRIEEFIDNIIYLNGLQKEFYKRYINARKELILEPALDMVMSMERRQGPAPGM